MRNLLSKNQERVQLSFSENSNYTKRFSIQTRGFTLVFNFKNGATLKNYDYSSFGTFLKSFFQFAQKSDNPQKIYEPATDFLLETTKASTVDSGKKVKVSSESLKNKRGIHETRKNQKFAFEQQTKTSESPRQTLIKTVEENLQNHKRKDIKEHNTMNIKKK